MKISNKINSYERRRLQTLLNCASKIAEIRTEMLEHDVFHSFDENLNNMVKEAEYAITLDKIEREDSK